MKPAKNTKIAKSKEENIALDIHESDQSISVNRTTSNGTENHFGQIIQNLPVAIYTCDNNGLITMFNEAAAKLWGRRPSLGKDLWCGSWQIFRPDGSSLPLSECPMALTLKEGRAVEEEEIVIERPDGRRFHVIANPRPLFNNSGELTGAVNMLLDVTAEKQAAAALKESEERFRTMSDQAPIVIWMTDEKGHCNYVNAKWTKVTGKKKEAGFGFGWLESIHPDDRERIYTSWTKSISKREPLDATFRYLNADQEFVILEFNCRVRLNSLGQFVGYIGTLHDITSEENAKDILETEIRRKTQDLVHKNEELKKSEERFHKMISEVQDYAIILLDTNGDINNWNKGAEKIKGYKAEEAIGKNFRIFYGKQDLEQGLPEKLIGIAAREGRATHEGYRVRKDGTTFWGSVVLTALHDDENNIVGFSKVTRDLTERKRAEDELLNTAAMLAEQNRELESMNKELASFAYVSSHDLQEPLRKIQTFASRIIETEYATLSPKAKDYFERMQNAALRMQTLIEDLLTYSRTNTAEQKIEATDLNQILDEVRNDLKEVIEEKHAVVTSSQLPKLKAVPFQMRQLFTNILGNALKFSNPDVPPQISITTELVNGSQINNTHANSKKSYHHIAVQDNGIGFESEHSTKIFEVFQRLHGRSEYSGTGIGLAICKKIVENHGGIIAAESELDKGATFHIYFPV